MHDARRPVARTSRLLAAVARAALLVIALAAPAACAPPAATGAPAPAPVPGAAAAAKKAQGCGAIDVGSKAPPVSFESVNGHGRVSIERGHVTLLHFFATWEEPSKKAFPKYAELYAKYKDRGFRLMTLSVDEAEQRALVVQVAHLWGANFPVGYDADHAMATCFELRHEPAAYLIDKGGMVRKYFPGYHDGEVAEIEQAMLPLL